MKTTFFGHKDTPENIAASLEKILIELIEKEGACEFYVGNQGNFDYMVRKILKNLKKRYPFIEYIIVLAYMPRGNELGEEEYELSVLPEEAAEAIPRFAIDKRNKWLVENADAVVTYVTHTFGGAYKFKRQAERKGKRIIEISELCKTEKK